MRVAQGVRNAGMAGPSPRSGGPGVRRLRRRGTVPCRSAAGGGSDSNPSPDPPSGSEALETKSTFVERFRTFLGRAPRVRFRTRSDRRVDQLAELVVLNEKLRQWDLEQSRDFDEDEDELLDDMTWIDCRTKVEFLKTRKENWEAVYESVSSHETEATLSDVERIDGKVSSVLKDTKDSLSVPDAADQLLALQVELQQAHERIHLSQARLGFLSERLAELESEASLLSEDCQDACELGELGPGGETEGAADPSPSSPSSSGDYDLSKLPLASASGGAATSGPSAAAAEMLAKGLHAGDSSLETNTWYPVCLAENVRTQDDVVAFELKGRPWVLFLNNEGEVACVKDECSHRACPLSLGTVNKDTGCIQCAYHGWEYDKDGQCTDMPSTNITNRSKMNLESLLVSKSSDGILWVTHRSNDAAAEAGPPILTNLDQNDCLVEVLVDKIPMRSESLIDCFTIGGFDLASEVYTRVVDFAFKRPLTIGFALDATGRSQIMDYELKFVSHYAFKICLFEKDARTGKRNLDKGMTMVFSFVPESPKKTNLIFQLYRRNNAGGGGGTRTKDKFPFSLPVHKDFVMRQWEEHIIAEIRGALMEELQKRSEAHVL